MMIRRREENREGKKRERGWMVHKQAKIPTGGAGGQKVRKSSWDGRGQETGGTRNRVSTSPRSEEID